jgi:hypothetical protein
LKITKDNFINYIGKNAIFYYFAQGMSSSVVYFVVAALKESVNTWVLMVFIYALNVVCNRFCRNFEKNRLLRLGNFRIFEKENVKINVNL